MDLKFGHGNVGSEMHRHDLHLTSTGRGHHFSNGYVFPPSNFRRTVPDPLPPPLTAPDKLTWNDQVMNHYETTTGTTHNFKYMGGLYGNPSYKKAAGSWKVHYVKDNVEKLKNTESRRRPLTMGVQSSEMRAQYAARPSRVTDSLNTAFRAGPQPFNLAGHHKSGPSQKVVASTQNPAMAGREYFVRDKGTLNLNDVYLTSAAKAYRSFKKEELLDYPKKNAPTYWECEEYPKAWGHGGKENPLPKDSVPRERPPLRDGMWFPSATKIPRIPKAAVPVPHKGLTSLVRESYVQPADVKMKEIFLCPIPPPYVTTIAKADEIMKVPKMYRSEYTTYGSGRPVTVT